MVTIGATVGPFCGKESKPEVAGSTLALAPFENELRPESLDSNLPSSPDGSLIPGLELRLSGLSNGSSSLAFIKDMKSLSFLRLRNNCISDSIPSNIGEYQQLSFLDLSFNSIRGQIPDSLFNLSLLHYLFLGNNELSGTLPAQKIPSLHIV
ncbi:hypothetical protein CMV_014175 [Castanea mollissima]|uniref:Uncharacterized protein n=1 Tax=Castanea mollissima TaxID=60419 RepID=A0A8J4VL88_9ROSI|nr:hypothetical protein CMV_014175 [Castanea mollissima]